MRKSGVWCLRGGYGCFYEYTSSEKRTKGSASSQPSRISGQPNNARYFCGIGSIGCYGSNSSDVMEAILGEKRTHDEMMDEEPSTSHSVNEEVLQTGRGEVDDNERPFYIESVRQVYTKKFRTNATSYRVRFTNVFADAEITSLYEQLHEIFQQVLDETVGGVPPQDQVRFLLHSNQLDKPIIFRSCQPNV